MIQRIRKITLFLMLSLIPALGFAQSANESYNNGLVLMKKQDYAGAIASFKASMAINKSAANVKKCNNQIAKCQNLMKKNTKVTSSPVVPEKKLSINMDALSFSAASNMAKSVEIITIPESDDWIASTEKDVDWIELAKSMDGKNLQVRCTPTRLTILRKANIYVKYGDIFKQIQVAQTGRKVNLSSSEAFVKFKMKGGIVTISVECNSDTTYNDNLNWTIDEVPGWLQAEKNKTTLVLKAAEIKKNDPDYKAGGRSCDIILRSQGEKRTIRVDQRKTFLNL